MIILDKKDLNQFGFAPSDIESVDFVDDSVCFTLKESTKEAKEAKPKKKAKKTKKAKGGVKKGEKRGVYKKKESFPAKKPKKSERHNHKKVLDCLNKHNGDKNAVIKKLGISIATVYNAIKWGKMQGIVLTDKKTVPKEKPKEEIKPGPMQEIVKSPNGKNYTYAHIYKKLENNDFNRKKVARDLEIGWKDVEKAIELHNSAKIDKELEGLDDFE